MSLDKKLREYLAKNTKKVASANISSEAERMRSILRKEIEGIHNKHGESFLNYIDIDNTIRSEVIDGVPSVTISLGFNEQMVHRDSLYPFGENEKGAYLPTLFDQGYTASDYVYGTDSHGNYARSIIHREGLHFMQRAVDEFNRTSKNGVVAILNDKYK